MNIHTIGSYVYSTPKCKILHLYIESNKKLPSVRETMPIRNCCCKVIPNAADAIITGLIATGQALIQKFTKQGGWISFGSFIATYIASYIVSITIAAKLGEFGKMLA